MSFTFLTPRYTRIGRGARHEAAALIAARATRVLLVRGGSVDWADTLAQDLEAGGVAVRQLRQRREPDIDDVRAAVEAARNHAADGIVAVGGGSVIDLGKAVAGLAPSPLDPLAYLTGGETLATPLPFVAIPTTAGTGAEATKNAVLSLPDGRKLSLRDDRLVPDLALVDPALTDGAPRSVTLASGMDAVVQLIEPYLSCRATPLTDALCRDQAPRAIRALATLMSVEDAAARDRLATASHLGGVALANSGLGVVHGYASVIGAFGGAHGAICARLLPAALAVNRAGAAKRGLQFHRFDTVRGWLADTFGADDPPARLRAFLDQHGLPSLADLGVRPEMHASLADAALGASSTQANLFKPTQAEMVEILRASA